MPKALILMLLLGVAAQANATSTPVKLRSIVASRDWSQGVTLCKALPDDESNRYDRPKPTFRKASEYAEMAVLCAAIESGAGDDPAADWWWFTATAIDLKTALDLLPELRSNGLLTQLAPPRTAVTNSAQNPKESPRLILPTGEEAGGERAKPVDPSRPPAWFMRAMRTPGSLRVIVELVVGADGIPRQPLLLTPKTPPLRVLLVFAWLRQWRFSPATVAGQPTASIYPVTLFSKSG